MDKATKLELIDQVITKLQSDLDNVIKAAQVNLDIATNEESKPENEYDTRSLEAGYIAGAQSQRAREIEEAISILKQIQVKVFDKKASIQVSALILVDHNNEKQRLFLLPKGAGVTLSFGGQKIKVITANSPLGEALVGLRCGDEAIIDSPKGSLEYEVLEIV